MARVASGGRIVATIPIGPLHFGHTRTSTAKELARLEDDVRLPSRQRCLRRQGSRPSSCRESRLVATGGLDT
jgi:hypothetical protein